jgi:hypothetical protein
MKHLNSNYSEVQGLGPLFDKPTPQIPDINDATAASIFTGNELKEKGLKQVSEHNENWMFEAVGACEWYVYNLTPFTGEDIRIYLEKRGFKPKHPNTWGALINTLIKRKIIVPTGEHRKMKDKTSHARSTPVYKAA